MSVFLRGSTYYVKARIGGRQVLRSLNTNNRAKAIQAADHLLTLLQGSSETQSDTTLIPLSTVQPGETLGTLFETYRRGVCPEDR